MRLAAASIAALLLCAGCRRPAPLPDDLVRAQAAERGPEPREALAEYTAILARCRSGARPNSPKDDCGLAALHRAELIEALERRGEATTAEAEQAYLDVRAVSADGRTIARAQFQAALLYSRHDPALAVKTAHEVVTRWSSEVAAEEALALEVQLRRDDPGLAADLDRLAATLPKDDVVASAALYTAAGLYNERGETDAAISRYDAVVARAPHGPYLDDALMAAAELLRKRGRSAEAAERLDRLVKTFRSSVIVGHYNLLKLGEGSLLLGEIYLRDLHDPARAIAALEGLLKRQPTSILCDDALYLMAEAALQRHTPPSPEDRAEACRLLDRLLKAHPDGNQVRRATKLRSELSCS